MEMFLVLIFFSEENQDWHLEDLDLIQTQQLIFSNKPANSSNNGFADAVSTTEFEKRTSDRIPKITSKDAFFPWTLSIQMYIENVKFQLYF